MLGTAAKVELAKENTTIVGSGATQDAVRARVKQIRMLISETEQEYEKEKLNERVARLSGGVAIIQVSRCLHRVCATLVWLWLHDVCIPQMACLHVPSFHADYRFFSALHESCWAHHSAWHCKCVDDMLAPEPTHVLPANCM